MSFAELIHNLLSSTEIINVLLKHECLLRCVIQWSFWTEEHRPDIVKLLNVEDCQIIAKQS